MTRISDYRESYPAAYSSLCSHLKQGNSIKSILIKTLFELGGSRFLARMPIFGDLINTAEGLLAGHIAESQNTSSSFPQFVNGVGTNAMMQLPDVLEFDVLIIGSGPGAAVAAEIEMKSPDSRIGVIERGVTPRTPNELHHSLTHIVNDFYQGGQELIVSQSFPLYAQGNVVGGGSEVNSGLFHNLPDLYRVDWANSFGVSVEQWLNSESLTSSWLEPEEMKVLARDSLLARGAEKENLVFENIARWRSYNADGTYLHRGMNAIFWDKQVVRQRISFFCNAEAYKIDTSNQNFVEVFVKNTQTGTTSSIRTKRLHVAAGAISTPNLLARSKLIRWRDTKFAWHPMIRIVAKSNKSDLGAGDIDPFQAWTPDRLIKFGSAVSTAPLLSVALGRVVSSTEASELRSFYVSFSSSGKGGILPLIGLPWYWSNRADRSSARKGVEILKRVISKGGGQILNLEKVSGKKFSTVHIFGTLPISSSVYVNRTNQLKQDPRVRVSDASILPFGPGVNPQAIVMSSVRIANRDLDN
jgi:hypothetical protein